MLRKLKVTNRLTKKWMDQPTNIAGYRVACRRLRSQIMNLGRVNDAKTAKERSKRTVLWTETMTNQATDQLTDRLGRLLKHLIEHHSNLFPFLCWKLKKQALNILDPSALIALMISALSFHSQTDAATVEIFSSTFRFGFLNLVSLSLNNPFIPQDTVQTKLHTRPQRNKAGYTATPVACGWAGAVIEVTPLFGQEQ